MLILRLMDHQENNKMQQIEGCTQAHHLIIIIISSSLSSHESSRKCMKSKINLMALLMYITPAELGACTALQ